MFLAVPTDQPASCQQDPERFRLMRGSQFAPWSDDTLESYLADLKAAVGRGRNLMQLKYARMDNLIPPLTESPLVDRIVGTQVRWQRELEARYPWFMRRGRPVEDDEAESLSTSFARYLRGELETYSETTLERLHRDVERHLENGENMAEAVYSAMVAALGYESLADAEAHAESMAKGK